MGQRYTQKYITNVNTEIYYIWDSVIEHMIIDSGGVDYNIYNDSAYNDIVLITKHSDNNAMTAF